MWPAAYDGAVYFSSFNHNLLTWTDVAEEAVSAVDQLPVRGDHPADHPLRHNLQAGSSFEGRTGVNFPLLFELLLASFGVP